MKLILPKLLILAAIALGVNECRASESCEPNSPCSRVPNTPPGWKKPGEEELRAGKWVRIPSKHPDLPPQWVQRLPQEEEARIRDELRQRGVVINKVPEPSTLVLLCAGLGAAIAFKRRC